MPNYIDLLRSHHQPGKKETATPVTEEEHRELLQEEEGYVEPGTWDPQSEADLLVEEDESAQTSGKGSSAKPTAATDDKQWLNHCVHYVANVFKTAGENKLGDTTILSDHVKTFIASIPNRPDQLAVLELMISEKGTKIQDLYGGLVTKSIMLMLYAIKMGQQLQLDEDELHALVMAGMLHHIGMAQVPASIRDKKEKLTKDEFKQISHSPKLGAEYLQQCGVSDKRILSAALQARERFDGSGPTGLKGNEISSTARIVSLLSLFEALVHYRAYRKRMLPRAAIREILLNHKKAYDPEYLKCLLDAISLYPVGTYVQLNSGDIGQVVRVHRRLPLRPVVHINMDRHGSKIKPRDIDLQTQANLIVERCMYPEDLKDL